MANGWTLERRQRQVEIIHQWNPWEKSTGAKTIEGKARASLNAYKGAVRPRLRKLAKVLKGQQEVIEEISAGSNFPV